MTPTYHGRKMKKVKEYPNFILYIDPVTKIRVCYTHSELQRMARMEARKMFEGNENHIPRID